MLINLKKLLGLQIVHLAIIVSVCVIAYSNSFKAPFMFDDYTNIIEKSVVRDIGQYKDNYLLITPQTNRRFVAILTFALNYKLHGMDVRGYHVFNLIVHAISALLVYQLIRLIAQTPDFKGYSLDFEPDLGIGVTALFTALLFAVHPVQTSAVTYIVQRYTSLATLFCLISLIGYLKSRLTASASARYALYAASIFFAILAMRTKEIAFTLPAMAVLCEFMFFEGKIRTRILYLLPLISTMLIIPVSVLASGAASTAAAVNSAVTHAGSDSSAGIADITRAEYLLTQFRVIVTYLRLLFFPVGLNLDYDYPILRGFFIPGVFLSFLVLVSIVASAVYMLYRSRTIPRDHSARYAARLYSFGILWFFIALSVESSVIPIKDVINEYRLYYPSVGFFIAVIAVVMWIARGRLAKTYTISALLAILVVLCAMTILRNEVWADRVKLWEDTVRKSPNKARPHYNLGYDYIRQGRVADASREFQTAIILKPDFADAYNNLGDIYASQGRMDEALYAFKKAVLYSAGFAVAYNNIGTIYDERGQFEEAAANYKTAIKLQTDYTDARLNLGNLLIKANRHDEAAWEFQEVLRFDPSNAEAADKLLALRAIRK